MSTEAAAPPREYRHFIGGEWVAGEATFEDRDPFTSEAVAMVPAGGREDAARAVAAAAEAAPGWAAAVPAERQAIFLRAAAALEARGDEVVALLARETGC